MKCAVIHMGTPGALFSVVMQNSAGALLVLDRKADTWERVGRATPEQDEGLAGDKPALERYAVIHEPSRRATTCKSQRIARELAAEVSGLSRADAKRTIESWEAFA